MPTNAEILAVGFQHHQAGRFEQAKQFYQQVLAVDPNHADALHLLGVIALQMGQHEFAVEYIRRAIESNGTEAGFHCNLGNAFQAQGKLDEAVTSFRRALELSADYAIAHGNLGNALCGVGKLDEAIACFRRVVELKPDSAEAHSNLANALHNQGSLSEAVTSYCRALELKPDFFVGHYNLANALQAQGKLDEAVASYHRALALVPNHADAHSNLGAAFKEQGKLDDAVASYRRAAELKPDCAIAHYNLGAALREHEKLDEAFECHRRAIELNPNCAEAHNELGNVFMDQRRVDEALEAYCRALALKPDLAEAHNNLGGILHGRGEFQEAERCYKRALELKPDYVEAHSNHSMLLLLRGELERGWPEYEWRWRFKRLRTFAPYRPTWDGTPVGKHNSILMHIDGGMGDTLHFIRYAPLIKQRAGRVLLRCSKKLIPLLSRCRGIDQLIPLEAKLPEFDVQTSLMSLPLAFRTTMETVPNEVPYLFAESELVGLWRSRLREHEYRVGIAWQGSPEYDHDDTRSIPLGEFAPLAEIQGVRLISLQKGFGSEQLAGVKDQFEVMELPPDLDESTGAFMDTAALMMHLDLVIACDTSIAHLAGGLGVPVWVTLSHVPDWRWLLDRSDSPWYPTARLFRQSIPGDWPGVFEQIKAALAELLSKQHED